MSLTQRRAAAALLLLLTALFLLSTSTDPAGQAQLFDEVPVFASDAVVTPGDAVSISCPFTSRFFQAGEGPKCYRRPSPSPALSASEVRGIERFLKEGSWVFPRQPQLAVGGRVLSDRTKAVTPLMCTGKRNTKGNHPTDARAAVRVPDESSGLDLVGARRMKAQRFAAARQQQMWLTFGQCSTVERTDASFCGRASTDESNAESDGSGDPSRSAHSGTSGEQFVFQSRANKQWFKFGRTVKQERYDKVSGLYKKRAPNQRDHVVRTTPHHVVKNVCIRPLAGLHAYFGKARDGSNTVDQTTRWLSVFDEAPFDWKVPVYPLPAPPACVRHRSVLVLPVSPYASTLGSNMAHLLFKSLHLEALRQRYPGLVDDDTLVALLLIPHGARAADIPATMQTLQNAASFQFIRPFLGLNWIGVIAWDPERPPASVTQQWAKSPGHAQYTAATKQFMESLGGASSGGFAGFTGGFGGSGAKAKAFESEQLCFERAIIGFDAMYYATQGFPWHRELHRRWRHRASRLLSSMWAERAELRAAGVARDPTSRIYANASEVEATHPFKISQEFLWGRSDSIASNAAALEAPAAHDGSRGGNIHDHDHDHDSSNGTAATTTTSPEPATAKPVDPKPGRAKSVDYKELLASIPPPHLTAPGRHAAFAKDKAFRVTVVMRPPRDGRAFRNEAQLEAALRAEFSTSKPAMGRPANRKVLITVLNMGAIPLIDQAAIAHSTDVLVASHGAAMGWMLFMPPHAVVVELSNYYRYGATMGIDQSCQSICGAIAALTGHKFMTYFAPAAMPAKGKSSGAAVRHPDVNMRSPLPRWFGSRSGMVDVAPRNFVGLVSTAVCLSIQRFETLRLHAVKQQTDPRHLMQRRGVLAGEPLYFGIPGEEHGKPSPIDHKTTEALSSHALMNASTIRAHRFIDAASLSQKWEGRDPFWWMLSEGVAPLSGGLRSPTAAADLAALAGPDFPPLPKQASTTCTLAGVSCPHCLYSNVSDNIAGCTAFGNRPAVMAAPFHKQSQMAEDDGAQRMDVVGGDLDWSRLN